MLNLVWQLGMIRGRPFGVAVFIRKSLCHLTSLCAKDDSGSVEWVNFVSATLKMLSIGFIFSMQWQLVGILWQAKCPTRSCSTMLKRCQNAVWRCPSTRTTKMTTFHFLTNLILCRTLNLTILNAFPDNCVLICRWDRVATTYIPRDINYQSFRTLIRLSTARYDFFRMKNV